MIFSAWLQARPEHTLRRSTAVHEACARPAS